tara:strand:+ start:548 stop:1036 length:489 start_codon:yes stop_codon:yes gene_type:complete
MILQYFKKKENIEKVLAKDIYKKILFESNSILNKNTFFKEKNYKVSFEIVSILMIFYIQYNINNKIKNYKRINEELVNLFILDLDESLRVKGIGDMSIGKYVKSYVKKFYFRLSKFPKIIELNHTKNLEVYFSYFDFIDEKQNIQASKVFLEFYKNIKIQHN